MYKSSTILWVFSACSWDPVEVSWSACLEGQNGISRVISVCLWTVNVGVAGCEWYNGVTCSWIVGVRDLFTGQRGVQPQSEDL